MLDLLTLGQAHPSEFDLIMVNAVFYVLADPELQKALENIAAALRPGGWLIAFDLFHPREQQLLILETSQLHPEGHPLHIRPYSRLRGMSEAAGLGEVGFEAFRIPIELPEPEGLASTATFTVDTVGGDRLPMRGVINQPWCHFRARRPA